MSDRNIFNQIVYTPMSEAIKLLEERRKDPKLVAMVSKLLNGDIPDFFKNKKYGILGRHIATPNNESRRFIDICKENDLYPVFFEYHDDKFSSNNEFKHSLGQLYIQEKVNKNGNSNVEKITIVDFNLNNGKKLKDIKTLWAEPLIDFHRKLFNIHNYKTEDFHMYNASDWFKNNGGHKASDFYTNFLTLFVYHGILFENFLTSKDVEGDFTESIVLPAINNIINRTGVKPLIVPLEPLDMETDSFWLNHLSKVKEIIPTQKHD